MQRLTLNYARPLASCHYPRRPIAWFRSLAHGAATAAIAWIALLSYEHLLRTMPRKTLSSARAGNIAAYQAALAQFQNDTGWLPTSADGLSALLKCPLGVAGWKGPYIRQIVPDPWGRPYVYRSNSATSCTVLSVGRDGKEGTADDIR